MGINTLEEFLNENMHRNYPILDSGDAKDTTGTYNLPTELIADMSLTVPDGAISAGVFYISGLVVRRYTIDVEISYSPNNTDPSTVIGWFHNIDTSAAVFESYSLVTIPQSDSDYAEFEDIVGTLIAGNALASTTLPGSWSFGDTSTPLVETVPIEQLTKFRSLQIGDEVITGNIILKEGDNVSIETSYDAGTETTTITFSAQVTEDSSSITLTDDASIIAALTDIYGAPITEINGKPPDGAGAFTVAGADCISVQTLDTGIIVDNPCGEPCCDKESYLTPVYDSINQLNSRHVRLEDYLSTSVNNLDTLIGRLKDMENAVGLGGF